MTRGRELNHRGNAPLAALQELREQLNLAQVELAEQLDVSQNRVSAIERGDIDKTEVAPLSRYVDALGGKLSVQVGFGNESYKID